MVALLAPAWRATASMEKPAIPSSVRTFNAARITRCRAGSPRRMGSGEGDVLGTIETIAYTSYRYETDSICHGGGVGTISNNKIADASRLAQIGERGDEACTARGDRLGNNSIDLHPRTANGPDSAPAGLAVHGGQQAVHPVVRPDGVGPQCSRCRLGHSQPWPQQDQSQVDRGE